ncbi:hypothetical protein ASG87_00400 [Frateuria sp. Soil773]|uniref:hypothetical protein n=1 Tax=Frateuria sp. Soil773 TaxID=1736407 RepID=UPI00070214D2|nr:hypothetical protein [Frateuria sp. Soil773]KRE92417.1 hypothetical protein ASG87_00400 [Frateuria sp. Soil773]
MDPQDQRPKRPSLFVGDTEPAAQRNRILADIAGTTAKPGRPAKARRFGWIAFGVAGVCVVALLLWLSSDESPRSPVAATAADAPAKAAAGSEGRAGGTGATIDATTGQATAMIVSDAPARASQAAVPAPAAATSAQRQAAIELDKVFAPPARPAATTAAERRPAGKSTRRDDDVDLLTALMRHLDSRPKAPPGSGRAAAAVQVSEAERIERRLKVCPAANTVAGVTCRQRICAGHLGETPSCPAPRQAN